jgi:hypothetical protein
VNSVSFEFWNGFQTLNHFLVILFGKQFFQKFNFILLDVTNVVFSEEGSPSIKEDKQLWEACLENVELDIHIYLSLVIIVVDIVNS